MVESGDRSHLEMQVNKLARKRGGDSITKELRKLSIAKMLERIRREEKGTSNEGKPKGRRKERRQGGV